MYSTTSSRELSSMTRLCILARRDIMTLMARGSRRVARKPLKQFLASAAALGASRECEGVPPAERFTGPFDPLL